MPSMQSCRTRQSGNRPRCGGQQPGSQDKETREGSRWNNGAGRGLRASTAVQGRSTRQRAAALPGSLRRVRVWAGGRCRRSRSGRAPRQQLPPMPKRRRRRLWRQQAWRLPRHRNSTRKNCTCHATKRHAQQHWHRPHRSSRRLVAPNWRRAASAHATDADASPCPSAEPTGWPGAPGCSPDWLARHNPG